MIRFTELLPRRSVWSIALVLILAAVVVFLAVLQYRWIGELTQAERDRMQARLATSVELFRESFNRELTQLCSAFRPEQYLRATDEVSFYGRLYEGWHDGSPHAELVAGFFVASPDPHGRLSVSRYDGSSRAMRPAAEPEIFNGLISACPSLQLPTRPFEARPRRPGEWSLAFSHRRPFLIFPIYLFPMRPAPFFRMPPGPPRQWRPGPPQRGPLIPSAYLFLELDARFLQSRLLPAINDRVFAGPDQGSYLATVFLGRRMTDAVYSTDQRAIEAGILYDATVELLYGLNERPLAPGGGPDRSPLRPRTLLTACDPDTQYILAVRHHAGSVDLAARDLWRRNLAMSAAVLVLLTLSILLIIVSSQRAQRLARLHMEFAAGVSHEIRTPLAVISSAGDNLAEGAIVAPDQVREYGSLIRNEARQLSAMIEQTLRFAAIQAMSERYDLRPVDVREVVQEAISQLAPSVAEAEFQVVPSFQDAVPKALADPGALSRCVQNLIANALKYGGGDRQILVDVRAVSDRKRPVTISVSDHGLGILPKDLPHIFDPFYQGGAAAGSRARGVGLGLALTKDTVEAMGGKVAVETKAGRGTTFTLQLQASGSDITGDESQNTSH